MKKVIALMLTFAFSIGMLSAGTSAQAATQSSLAGTIATSSGGLNVRSAASSSSSVLTSLPKGSYVTLMSKSGNWWYVEYADGRYGYSHADYITPSNGSKAAVVSTSSGNLNVRQRRQCFARGDRIFAQRQNRDRSLGIKRVEPRAVQRRENRLCQQPISQKKPALRMRFS